MNPKLNSLELGKPYQPQVTADHSPSDTERNYKETSVTETAWKCVIAHRKTLPEREMVKAFSYKPGNSTKSRGLDSKLNNAEIVQ